MVPSARRPRALTANRRRLSRSCGLVRNLNRIDAASATSATAKAIRIMRTALCGMGQATGLPDWLLLEYLAVVLQELVETFIRQGVVEKHVEHLERHGADISTRFRSFDHMHTRAQRSGQDLGLESVIAIDRDDVVDEAHAVPTDVVHAAHKRADDISPRLGR